MATIVDNKKHFDVLKVSREEMAVMCDSPGVCDNCLDTPDTGYLVCVLNHWLCPKCFRNFIERAKRYDEDISYETGKFQYYLRLASLTGVTIEEEHDDYQ